MTTAVEQVNDDITAAEDAATLVDSANTLMEASSLTTAQKATIHRPFARAVGGLTTLDTLATDWLGGEQENSNTQISDDRTSMLTALYAINSANVLVSASKLTKSQKAAIHTPLAEANTTLKNAAAAAWTWLLANPITPPPPPPTPTWTVESVTDSTVTLVWANSAPSRFARDGFDTNGNGPWSEPVSSELTSGSFQFGLLIPGTAYNFTLTESGGATLVASATTLTDPVTNPSGLAMPAADAYSGMVAMVRDDLDGDSLDTVNNWLQEGDPSGFSQDVPQQYGSFMASHGSVGGSIATLSNYADPDAPAGSTPRQGTGMYSKWNGTNGLILVRARCDAGAGVTMCLGMMGLSWPPEADFYEDAPTQSLNRIGMYTTAHWGPSNMSNPTSLADAYPTFATLDAASWHTWGIKITSSTISYSVDGVVWLSYANPLPTGANSFSTPVFLFIQSETLDGSSVDGSTPTVVNMELDWVCIFESETTAALPRNVIPIETVRDLMAKRRERKIAPARTRRVMDPMAAWPTFEEQRQRPFEIPAQGEVVNSPALAPRVRTVDVVPARERCTTVRTIGRKEIRCCLRAGHEAEQDHF